MKNKSNNNNRENSKDTVTVIEFSANTVKLAQSVFKKKMVINQLAASESAGDSQEELTNALDKIIKENHIKIENLIVSLDRSLVIVRFIKLPSIDEKEIKEMSEWQAAKASPYKIEEIIVSHQTIKADQDGFSYILLTIAPKNIIKKFTDICDVLGLRPKGITISSQGLSQWYVNKQLANQIDGAVALIDIDKIRLELVVIYQDKFIFSRSLILPISQSDAQIKNKIIDEAKLSIESYVKQEASESIKRIILTGEQNIINSLSSLFANEFNIQVGTIDYLKDIDIDKENSRLKIIPHISFVSVCGLALGQGIPQINMLPQDFKDRILYLQKRKELVKTIFLSLFAALILFGVFGFNLYYRNNALDNLNKELFKIAPLAKQIQDIKNKINVINSQVSDQNSCIEILREVHKITPKEIFLQTFIFEEERNVALKGTAPSMSLVFGFVPVLNESKFFENVEVRYATQRKKEAGELTDFEIVCKLSNAQAKKTK